MMTEYPLSLPCYSDKVKIIGFRHKVTALNVPTTADAGAVLKRTCIGWTKDQHKEAAKWHKEQAKAKQKQWAILADKAALAAWGRKFQATDYRISGIGSDDFTPGYKDELRRLAQEQGKHWRLEAAHNYVARWFKLGRVALTITEDKYQ